MTKNTFLQMARDDQAHTVRQLMRAGGSFGSVARQLCVKRGRIAGICRDYYIVTTRSPGFEDLPKSSSGVVLKLSASGATQCEAMVNGHRCAYVREPGSRYCALPIHQALEQKRRAG